MTEVAVRALVTTPNTKFGVALADVPDPEAAAGHVVVDVHNVSLNFGEIRNLAGEDPGVIPGWDAAGVVAETTDGGPAVGTRVLTFGYGGAWAQKRSVALAEVGVVPDGVDLAVAAAVPVAGVTALRALRASGPLDGKRVLITGASGGVGRYALQLAALEGAHVIAAARRGDGLTELGAKEVVATLDDLDPVDVILDNVGGQQLVTAWQILAPGGVLQSIGWTSLEPATFPVYATVGLPKALTAFQMGTGIGTDMEYVLGLIAQGKLEVDLGYRGSWSAFDDAAGALMGRKVVGKAVLDLD
jgi:NADPH2:quinone reductase